MAKKILAVSCETLRLVQVTHLLRSHGHNIKGADCRSTMRDLLARESFRHILVLDHLPASFSEAIRELPSGSRRPSVIHAEGVAPDEVLEIVSDSISYPNAA